MKLGWISAPQISADTLRPRDHLSGQSLTFAGVTQSFDAWSAQTGVSAITLRIRTRRGWSPERTLTTPALARGQWNNNWRGKYADQRLTLNGVTLHVSEWAQARGLRQNTVSMRLLRGATVAEALAVGRKPTTPNRTCSRCGGVGHTRPTCQASVYSAAMHMKQGRDE